MARKITRAESRRVTELAQQISPETFRTVFSTGKHPINTARLERLQSGTGTLSPGEIERLKDISSNASRIEQLEKRNEDKEQWKVRHAIQDWIAGGKTEGIPASDKEANRRAAKGLGYLGVDVKKKTYYVKRKGRK